MNTIQSTKNQWKNIGKVFIGLFVLFGFLNNQGISYANETNRGIVNSDRIVIDASSEQVYIDPLYNYKITVPSDWHVIPTLPDAVYGAAVFLNHDPTEIELSETPPEELIKVQIGMAPIWEGWTFDMWAQGWQANEIIQGEGIGDLLSLTTGNNRILTLNHEPKQDKFGSDMYSKEYLINFSDRVMVVIVYSNQEKNLIEPLQLIDSLDVSDIKDFPIEIDSFKAPNFEELILEAKQMETALLQETSPTYLCPIGDTFPGDNAPTAPWTLHMPFKSGQTWIVGGSGSFYGNGMHCNTMNDTGAEIYGDHYATDWNRYEGNELNEFVYPIGSGNISKVENRFPTCVQGLGCYVVVDHFCGFYCTRSVYAHLNNVYRTDGPVNHREKIGAVGATGDEEYTPHLHLSFLESKDGGATYHSYCSSGCATNEPSMTPQTMKPAYMYTAQYAGNTVIRDGWEYTSVNRRLVADINNDGEVNILDYTLLFENYDRRGFNRADLNIDGIVDILDYTLLFEDFGSSSQNMSSSNSSKNSNEYRSSAAIPNPPSNLYFRYELNYVETFLSVHLFGSDNSNNENGFYVDWDIENFDSNEVTVYDDEAPAPLVGDPLEYPESDKPISAIAVIPCSSYFNGPRSITASVSSFNEDGSSPLVTVNDVVNIPDCPKPGDVNRDGKVNVSDIIKIIAVYHSSPPEDLRADQNFDGRVNVQDIIVVLKNYPTTTSENGNLGSINSALSDDPNTIVFISPEYQTKNIGDKFEYSVMMDTDNDNVAGFDLEIKFDTSVYTITSIEKGNGVINFATEAINEVNNDDGEILYGLSTSDISNVVQGSNIELMKVFGSIKSDVQIGYCEHKFGIRTITANDDADDVLQETISGKIEIAVTPNICIKSTNYLPITVGGSAKQTKTVSINGLTTDGEALNNPCGDWEICRNASQGTSVWQGLEAGTVGSIYTESGYMIARPFLFFDTSSIPSNATITSATLNIYASQWQNGNKKFHVVKSNASLPLSIEDFSKIEYTSGGSKTPSSPFIWMEIPLNSSALNWIKPGDMTQFVLVHEYDFNNVTPTEPNDVLIAFAEDADHKPYLTITYEVP